MYKVGLTGGIGSGKSKVADMLAAWGAAVVDTDVIAHDLTAPGGRRLSRSVRLLGRMSLRQMVRSIVPSCGNSHSKALKCGDGWKPFFTP